MAKPVSKIAQETIDLYDKLVKTNPRVERKGATLPYTAINGNMFSMLDETGSLVLRLPEGEREAFIKKYKTGPHETHGIVRKEYVVVPGKLLANTHELKKYFDLSYDYAKGLKPKPNKKKK